MGSITFILNNLTYILKHLTEWQLTGTFQQNDLKKKHTQWVKKKHFASYYFYFFLALLFNMFQVPLKELERKSYVVSVVFEGRQ